MAKEETSEAGSAASADAHDRGPLTWPRFYGPSIEYGRSAWNRYGLLAISAVAFVLFLVTGILLLHGSADSGQAVLNLLIAAGIPVFVWAVRRSARTSMDPEAMHRRGDLDWDLHEKGILVREYDGGLPGRVRASFVPFESLSRAYVKMSQQSAREVWELAKDTAWKARKASSEEDAGADFRWDDKSRSMVEGSIWLVGRESGRVELRLVRGQLADAERFEALLRKNVKDVD